MENTLVVIGNGADVNNTMTVDGWRGLSEIRSDKSLFGSVEDALPGATNSWLRIFDIGGESVWVR